MPKKKADQSVDEWLRERTTTVEASRIVTEANCNMEAVQLLTTAEGVPAGVTTEPCIETRSTVATTADVALAKGEVASEDGGSTGDVAANEDEATAWFWNLLAQSGYKRW